MFISREGWNIFPPSISWVKEVEIISNHCNIKLLFRFINRVDKDYRNNKTARDNPVDQQDSDTSKDIKKGMDKFEAKIKAGEAPAADATRSDE
jgi:hypothetical protein